MNENKKIKIPVEFWMLLPTIILLGTITIYPFIYLIKMSFMKYSTIPTIPTEYIGAANWIELFHDKAVGHSWVIFVTYYIGAIFSQLFLGIGIALLIDRLPKGQILIFNLLIIPMFFAPVLTGLLWRFLLHDAYGMYTYFFNQLGIFKGISILGNIKTALPFVIIMDTWEWTPLIAIIVLAGLKNLSSEVIEASSIDGAGYFQQLRYIILPLLKSVILIAFLLRTMDLFRFYTKILITTGGGPGDSTKIVALRIFEHGFRFYRLGYASTIALTLLFSTIILSEVFFKYILKKR